MTTPGAALSGGGASPPEEARLDRQREPLPTDVGPLPHLPAAYAHALEAGLDALGLRLTPDARAVIDGHVRLLLAWNRAINLTAITEPEAVARLHVVDSLAGWPAVAAGPHASLVDLGSGGGFPGLPLGAVLPATRVALVESVGKKARFLETAARATGLDERVTVRAGRAEDLGRARDRRPAADVVTARALGSLADLVELALPLLGEGGRLVAWKRGDLAAELAAGARAAHALGGADPIVTAVPGAPGLVGHVLVVVTKRGATPAGYPRDPAARKRRPW